MDRIPTGRPSWNEAMRNAALAVLDSKQWVKGSQGKAFGLAFADYCGALSATPCQNGSSALWAALRIANIGPGDEVIVPSYTFISTATCILLVGATPVFVDVEPDYFCLDVNAVQSAITPATKGVIGVHLYGHPYDAKIVEICETHGLVLIEDAAQAHGASQSFEDGSKKAAGSMGDIACFSFFPSKNMAVGGEGGMLTTTNDAYAAKLNAIVNHGRSPELHAMELGSNMRMSEVAAAIGLEQLKHLDHWVERRRQTASRYTTALQNQPYLKAPETRPGAEHAWHQYCVRTEHPAAFKTHLDALQIDARQYYSLPIHQQGVFANHPQHRQNLPVTAELGSCLVAIPIMHELTEVEITRVLAALVSFNPE
ncbi:MAG: DegT/DnrJ/EryC1/StrS family aminotransferase [Euryarchaeota archaeon]